MSENHTNANQCARLLAWLEERPIDPLDAWTELGIYRLSARIFELRQAGYEIETRRVDVLTTFDERITVAEYHLAGHHLIQ